MKPAAPVTRRVAISMQNDEREMLEHAAFYILHLALHGSDRRAFRVLKRETKFFGERVDCCASSFPGAVAFEAQIADSPAPRRNDAADGAEIRAICVVLIEPADHVGRYADECAEG